MAAATRAFRRHLTWTLIAAFLAAAILTGCNGDDDPPPSAPAPPPGATYEPPPTTSPPSDATVLDELGRVSRSWLSGFGSPSTPDQRCSGTEFRVDVTGADAGDLEPCLLGAGNGLNLQVHNRTGVPITISGPDIVLWTVQPNSTVDIPLKGNPVNQSFNFKPNVAAGVSMALLDKFGERPVPEALQWANCFLQPDTRCLADLVIPHLPREIKIGNAYVPVQWSLRLLAELWDQRSLMNDFVGHVIGKEGGRMTVQEI